MWKRGLARGAWLVTLAPAALSASVLAAGLGGGGVSQGEPPEAATSTRPSTRVACPTPETLRLRRFEDGSAQLLCGRRVTVRVSVPG